MMAIIIGLAVYYVLYFATLAAGAYKWGCENRQYQLAVQVWNNSGRCYSLSPGDPYDRRYFVHWIMEGDLMTIGVGLAFVFPGVSVAIMAAAITSYWAVVGTGLALTWASKALIKLGEQRGCK